MEMKERVVKLINKIYVEQDKEKIYKLLLEFYPMLEEDWDAVKEVILGEEHEKQIDKVGDIVMKDEKRKTKNNKSFN